MTNETKKQNFERENDLTYIKKNIMKGGNK